MKKFNKLIMLPLVLACLLLLANSLNISHDKPHLNISKEDSAINIKADFLTVFNLGLKRFIASFVWIQTVLESDIEHYKKNDGNSWIYHRINTIITLDPYFEWAYVWGGQYLSVIKDDIYGAKHIYEKGLVYFPDHFWLNFYAGFNYYWELGDCESAYKVFNHILKQPSATEKIFYLPSLVARTRACTGDLETAFMIISDSYKNAIDGTPLKEKLHQNAYDLKAEIDLACLNGLRTSCQFRDFDGNPYLFKNGKYKASKEWKPFRLKKRSRE